MSRLAELIEQLCPDGVEYRALGDVGVFVRGGGLQKADFVETGMPCVHYGQIHTRFGISVSETVTFVSEAQFARLKHADYGDLLIATTSEDDEAVGKATAWLGDGEVAISGDMFYYRHNLEPKYVSYFFASSSFQDQKRPYLTGAKVRRIADKGLSRIQIPVPPLEVQREIVRILDQFTTLEAELEAELEARRTQYEHYRNHLLSYESLAAHGPVEMVKLGDMLELRAGNSISSKYIFEQADSEYIYPCYGANGLRGYVQSMTHENDASIIGRQGALCGNVTYAYGPFFATEHAVVVTPRVALSQRWLYHSLIVADLSQYATKSAQPGLSVRRVAGVEIPVPCLSEQRRIADLLDRFDALVNDISSGLPAEINARRTQYEYYRDRLMSFPENPTD